jgi:cytoskeletal protein CcmA (bactofilin family)
MVQARQARAAGAEQNAHIGEGTRIRGRVVGDGNLTVEGAIEGEISLTGDVTIGEAASALSDIQAVNVTIAGNLEGNVEAQGQLRLVAGSEVRGHLRGSSLVMEEGAGFSGRLECEFDLPRELQEGPSGRR